MKNKITVLTLCALLCALSVSVQAQQAVKIPRIGYPNDGALKRADVVVSTIPV